MCWKSSNSTCRGISIFVQLISISIESNTKQNQYLVGFLLKGIKKQWLQWHGNDLIHSMAYVPMTVIFYTIHTLICFDWKKLPIVRHYFKVHKYSDKAFSTCGFIILEYLLVLKRELNSVHRTNARKHYDQRR